MPLLQKLLTPHTRNRHRCRCALHSPCYSLLPASTSLAPYPLLCYLTLMLTT